MKKIVTVIGVLSVISMLFAPSIFAENTFSDVNANTRDVSKMVNDATNYKEQLEKNGEEVKSIDCKLVSPSGEEYIVKAYPTSEPVLSDPVLSSDMSSMSFLSISEEQTGKLETYSQTYVADINTDNIYAEGDPSQTDGEYSNNGLGSVQAYSTLWYTKRMDNNMAYFRIDRVKAGWAIVDTNTVTAERFVKARTCGITIPLSTGTVETVQELPYYVSSNEITFDTGFRYFAVPPTYNGSSIGSYQSCYINRANQGWWQFEFVHHLLTS